MEVDFPSYMYLGYSDNDNSINSVEYDSSNIISYDNDGYPFYHSKSNKKNNIDNNDNENNDSSNLN